MENELIDFETRENFKFFTYGQELTERDEQEFLSDCQMVLEKAHATALETLKLASSLANLKFGFKWRNVINPETGKPFDISSFEKFSNYAFGFSKTKTSNLLSLSTFVVMNEETGGISYRHERYASMNMSQLIEIAPLPEENRKYFTSKIPVADMRVCKKYMSDGIFLREKNKKGFDLLTNAKRWEVERETKQVVDEVERTLKKAPTTEYFQNTVPTSEFWEEGKTISFCSRSKIREFLLDFESWETVNVVDGFFDTVKRFRFKDGTAIFATTYKNCVDVKCSEEKTLVLYFLSRFEKTIKISKAKLEVWLKANESNLI